MARLAFLLFALLPALSLGRDVPLPTDQAFGYQSQINQDGVHILFKVAPGYHLYLQRLKIAKGSDGVEVGVPLIPEGEWTDDPAMGKTRVLRGSLDIKVPITALPTPPAPALLQVKYQGCQDEGSCYPPQNVMVDVSSAPITSDKGPIIASECEARGIAGESELRSEQCRIVDALKQEDFFSTGLSFLGMGLLLAFTPCIFPMIPILSGLIAGQGQKISTKRAFTLSLAYVLASALAYTLFGILAGLFGHNLQATLQHPKVIITFSAFFVVLALSMFGAFTIQLPSVLQHRLIDLSNRQKSGTVLGSAAMGFLSALIVGPCVAAPLAGALIYIGETGDAIYGGFALFSLGIGMGLPLLAIGTSAGSLLPKAGLWMESVKAFFGFGLLGIAIWLLSRIAPPELMLFLWGALSILIAVTLGALEDLPRPSLFHHRLAKGLGIIFLAYGILLLIGASASGHDPLHPLERLSLSATSKQGSESHALKFVAVNSTADLDAQLARAQSSKTPVLLDFYADWCTACQEMEEETFVDPDVQKTLSHVLLLKADITDSTDDQKALLRRYGLIGPPATLFFREDGQEVKSRRIVGFIPPAPFNQHVIQALGLPSSTTVR